MARGGDYSLEPVTGLAAYNDGESMAYGEAKDSESELRSSPYSILQITVFNETNLI